MNSSKLALTLALAGVVAAGSYAYRSTALAESPQQTAAEGKALGTVQDLSTAFRQIGKDVEPCVVNIQVKKVIEAPANINRRGPMNDPFFRRFFDQNGDGEPDLPMPGFGMPPGGEQIGQGSGVIIDVDGKTGYIVTNNHVAGDADEITVALSDGRTIENGTLVGADPKTDIAVIKIEADDLKAGRWGNSDDLEKGDWVLAFGSPFGYVGSMTHGVVSATNRTNMNIIPEGYESFLQIDAPINPGNSGGPLTNIKGEIVGINTAIASRSGGFQGIGFAIPSNQAKQIYTALREHGKVVRGWLGVKIASVSDPDTLPVAQDMGYTGTHGVFIHETFPNTPAAGILKVGDIVTKINGKQVNDSSQLRNTIAMVAPGSDVKLEVFRDGKTQNLTIKLGNQPANLAAVANGEAQDEKADSNAPANAERPRLGVTLDDITPEVSAQLRLPKGTQGALITRVAPGSPAAKARLSPGDVITKVGDAPVTSAEAAVAAISKVDLKKGTRLYVVNAGGGRVVFVQAHEPKPAKK